MIFLTLQGGLGSQLFQICTLIAYSNHFNTEFKIKKTKVDFINGQGYKRPTYWESFFKELKPYLVENINCSRKYQDPYFHYSPLPNLKEDPNLDFIINGVFHSPIYFNSKINEINDILKLTDKKLEIKKKHMEVYDRETISLHFRIGDFKHPNYSDVRDILKFSYYKDALKEIIKKTNKKEYLVIYFYEKEDEKKVSDYIKYIKKDKKLKSLKFKKCNVELEDWEQLLLMSNCSHNIISNSAFSWWGAYLNNSDSKIVTYPSKWFGKKLDHIETKDICPFLNWVKINN